MGDYQSYLLANIIIKRFILEIIIFFLSAVWLAILSCWQGIQPGEMARNTTTGGILGLGMFSQIFEIIISRLTLRFTRLGVCDAVLVSGRFQKTWTIPSSHSSKVWTGYYKLSTLNPFLTNQTKHVRANFNRVWNPPFVSTSRVNIKN